MSEPAPRTAALCVAVLALVLRFGYLAAAGFPVERQGDALEYHAYAVSLVEDHAFRGLEGRRATRTPGYPFFLAALYAVYGQSARPVAAAQCVLGALTCLLLFFIARRLLDPPWPLVCGVAGAVYFGMIEPSVLGTAECLYSFCLAGSAAALLHGGWAPLARAGAGGVAFGLTALVRPEALPAVGLVLLFSPKVFPGFGRREAAVALTGLLLVVGLWTARNYAVFGRIVPVGTRGAANLYLGLQFPVERLGLLPREAYDPPKELGELETDQAFMERFKEDWRATGRGMKIKAYSFNILSVLYPFLPGYDITYALLVPFWLIGLWECRRRREWMLFGAVVLFSLIVYTFLGGPASRYRQGIAPYLVLLAVLGMRTAHESLPRDWSLRLAGGWAGLNLGVWMLSPLLRRAVLWLKAVFW